MFLKRTLYLLIALFVMLSVSLPVTYGQNPEIDSLKQELSAADDSKQIEVLITIAKLMSEYDLKASLKYAHEALGIANSLGDTYHIAICHKELGILYLSKGEGDESLKHLLTALKIMQTSKRSSNFSKVYNNLGTIYSRKGLLDSALFYHQAAYNLSISDQDSLSQISSLRLIGNAYYKKGDFDKALSHFRKGLSLTEYYNSTKEKSHLLNNLGILYSDWGEYDLSLKYYERALGIMEDLKNHSDMGRIYNNMGNIFWYKESYDSALIFYNKSLQKRKQIGDKDGEAYVLNNLGMIYGSQGDFDKSLEYFKHSLNLFDAINNRGGVVMATYNTAFVFLEKKDWDNAEKYLNQGLIIAQEQGYKDYITTNLDALSGVYEETNDWENAYFTLEKYKTINDSIRNQQNMDIIKELEIKYENEKYKADLSILKNQVELEKSKKNQNLIILIGVIIIIILIILSTYLLISRMKIRTTNQFDKLTPTLLRYQLNPEFINSSLVGIKELISKNRVKESGLFLSGFAKLMRTFIETSTNNAIILEKELDTIKQFIQLHQLRYDYDINFELSIDDEIETEMTAIPPLIIFPVFVHLIDNHLNSGKIDIAMKIELVKSKLQFNTTFNYHNFENIKKTDQSGLKKSISSIKDRIKSINKSYKEDIGFKYTTGYKKGESQLGVLLQFPIKPL